MYFCHEKFCKKKKEIEKKNYKCNIKIVISDGPLPGILHEVNLPIINNNACEGMYRDAGYIEHIPYIFICAGYREGGKDSCEVKKIKTK